MIYKERMLFKVIFLDFWMKILRLIFFALE